jgi:hypothetical protein
MEGLKKYINILFFVVIPFILVSAALVYMEYSGEVQSAGDVINNIYLSCNDNNINAGNIVIVPAYNATVNEPVNESENDLEIESDELSDGDVCDYYLYVPHEYVNSGATIHMESGYTVTINGNDYNSDDVIDFESLIAGSNFDSDLDSNADIDSNSNLNPTHICKWIIKKGDEIIYDSYIGIMMQDTEDTANTLYLNTQSGSMDYLYSNKENKESCEYSFVSSDETVSDNSGVCRVSGHGNSTWTEIEEDIGSTDFKHPFNLTLDESISILGMDAARKYVLIAGYYDDSLLRNQVALDAANAAGLEYTPEYRLINLYLNGEYAGLYMITQKIASDGIFTSMSTDDVLISFDFEERVSLENQFFTTNYRYGVIKNPENLSESKISEITDYMNRIEGGIMAADSDVLSYLDVDSWIRYGMIQGFFCNHDADCASQNLYYSISDGIVYAGPTWDFDFAMGHSILETGGMETSSLWLYGLRNGGSAGTGWLAALMDIDEYKEAFLDYYLSDFDGIVSKCIEGVEESTELMNSSLSMDSVRWNTVSHFDAADELCEWLISRQDFCKKYSQNPDDYCLVEFDGLDIGMRRNLIYAVPTGTELGEVLTARNITCWKTSDGEEVTATTVINEDMYLEAGE